jgi:hypothetical protein
MGCESAPIIAGGGCHGTISELHNAYLLYRRSTSSKSQLVQLRAKPTIAFEGVASVVVTCKPGHIEVRTRPGTLQLQI